jgi:hypothetical protein
MKIVTNVLMLVAPVVFLHRDVYIIFFCDNVFAYNKFSTKIFITFTIRNSEFNQRSLKESLFGREETFVLVSVTCIL